MYDPSDPPDTTLSSKVSTLSIDQLRTLYKDPSIGLIGFQAFLSKLKELGNEITPELEKNVQELFEDREIASHRPIKKNFPRRKVFIPHVDNTWGLDVAFLPKVSKTNDNYKAFLLVIDIFSRYAWVRPVKDTKSETISKEIRDVIKKSGRKPQYSWTDRGAEFYKETI
eukprot:Lithocolla_globosa_v1_NODE_4080_length_1515_cov_433.679452.p1 type:complete len:169 gc:universal NODE_4080_length_1515_cov_433.679452:1254-748(-)